MESVCGGLHVAQAIIACWLVVLLFMVIATAFLDPEIHACPSRSYSLQESTTVLSPLGRLIRLDMSLTGFEFRAAMASCLNNLRETNRKIGFIR